MYHDYKIIFRQNSWKSHIISKFTAIHSSGIFHLQNQKIELNKETDYQSELVTRGVDERDTLRNELKTIKDKENERERQRESERLAERRQQRENERIQTEYRMKLVISYPRLWGSCEGISTDSMARLFKTLDKL